MAARPADPCAPTTKCSQPGCAAVMGFLPRAGTPHAILLFCIGCHQSGCHLALPPICQNHAQKHACGARVRCAAAATHVCVCELGGGTTDGASQ